MVEEGYIFHLRLRLHSARCENQFWLWDHPSNDFENHKAKLDSLPYYEGRSKCYKMSEKLTR